MGTDRCLGRERCVNWTMWDKASQKLGVLLGATELGIASRNLHYGNSSCQDDEMSQHVSPEMTAEQTGALFTIEGGDDAQSTFKSNETQIETHVGCCIANRRRIKWRRRKGHEQSAGSVTYCRYDCTHSAGLAASGPSRLSPRASDTEQHEARSRSRAHYHDSPKPKPNRPQFAKVQLLQSEALRKGQKSLLEERNLPAPRDVPCSAKLALPQRRRGRCASIYHQHHGLFILPHAILRRLGRGITASVDTDATSITACASLRPLLDPAIASCHVSIRSRNRARTGNAWNGLEVSMRIGSWTHDDAQGVFSVCCSVRQRRLCNCSISIPSWMRR